ncbi:MAG TPA: hypothetical protein VGF48_01275 [Thermoanaerobaculia bacterium]
MKRTIILVLLILPAVLHAEGVYELRSRWTAKAHSKQTFDVTEIDRIGDTSGKSAFLVSRGDQRYVILDVSNYGKAKMTRIVRNVATGDYVQVSYTYRSSARTRAEFLAEARLRQNEEIEHILFETNRGRFTTRESQLYTPETRKALNAMVTPQFAVELQRLQNDLLGYVNLQIICRQVITPFTGGACERQSAPIVNGAKPDCDVDASFGFPCTASQRARSTKAAVHISTATRY